MRQIEAKGFVWSFGWLLAFVFEEDLNDITISSSWGYAASLGFIFATEEINRDIHLLPNLTLGFSIWDSGDSISGALLGTMDFLTGQGKLVPNYSCRTHPPITALAGELRSTLSMPMARWLGLYKFPQISYASSVISLSEKKHFPSFLRTNPSDQAWIQGIPSLLNHFGWIWVGIISDDDDFGQQGTYLMSAELDKFGICREFLINLPNYHLEERFQQGIHVLMRSTAKVIVEIISTSDLLNVIDKSLFHDIAGRIWIRNYIQWIVLRSYNPDIYQSNSIVLPQQTIEGIPSYSHLYPDRMQANTFMKTFWENTFKYKWKMKISSFHGNKTKMAENQFCKGSEHWQGQDIFLLDAGHCALAYSAYKVVYSIAHAIQDLSSCQKEERSNGNKMCPEFKAFKPWQLLHYIKKVHFQTPQKSEVFFDANGDVPTVYDIMIQQNASEGLSHLATIGSVDFTASHGTIVAINKSAILWSQGETQILQSVCSKSCPPGSSQIHPQGWSQCCFNCEPCPVGHFTDQKDMQQCTKCPEDQYPNTYRDSCLPKVLTFLSYEEPLGMTLSCMALVFSLLTVIVLLIFMKHRGTVIVKSNNRTLSYTLLLSLTLCFLCSLLFIGRPTTVSCFLRQMTIGIAFTVAISSVLAKTLIVVLAFKASRPGSRFRRWASTRVSNSVVLICSLIQVTLCGVWIAISPPFPDVVTDFEPGHILIVCNEGSITTFYCVLGYLGFLALGSFIVAFMARNLPDTFNEAKFITFSMLVFCSVWASFLPAYQSTKGKTMVAVEVFAILASGAGLLICIFIPKCYVILCKPHQNTQEWSKHHLHSRGVISP
ncbi:vomeronasal type-2 receptor 26-like [Macrotis lagotis]|uniref:vomeronasal type-2 receptor 26-like n=1 Tax=Macrotis lagotis TaxID=92651 RepID=UPI003D68E9E9